MSVIVAAVFKVPFGDNHLDFFQLVSLEAVLLVMTSCHQQLIRENRYKKFSKRFYRQRRVDGVAATD